MIERDGLVGCPACQRHVRGGSSLCPFCQTSISTSPRPFVDAPGGRASRATIMAGAALVALGCGVYGGPPPDERWRAAHETQENADAGAVDTKTADAATPAIQPR